MCRWSSFLILGWSIIQFHLTLLTPLTPPAILPPLTSLTHPTVFSRLIPANPLAVATSPFAPFTPLNSIAVVTQFGYSALVRAAGQGHFKLCAKLAELVANPNLADIVSETCSERCFVSSASHSSSCSWLLLFLVWLVTVMTAAVKVVWLVVVGSVTLFR